MNVSTLLESVLPVFVACASPFILFAFFRLSRTQFAAKVAILRSEAEQQFLHYSVKSSDPKLRFEGTSANVVRDEESIQSDDDGITYSLTRFATNSSGEYFMFISSQVSKPFFKHIEHRIASIKLKELYVPPPETTANPSFNEPPNGAR